MTVASPVYLDANIIVGALVTKHPLYRSSVEFLGEIVASGAQIYVSVITVQEALWALAGISLRELRHQPNARFTKKIYHKAREEIFQKHGDRMQAVSDLLRDWTGAGIPIGVVPKHDQEFIDGSALIPGYMRVFGLTAADAAHLAIAENSSKALATADGDFRNLAEKDPGNIALEIIQVTA